MKKRPTVDAFLDDLDHPFNAEVQAIRDIIKGVNPSITEQIKWNAPSFSYNRDYLVTFNLRPTQHIHLVFHNPAIASIHHDILKGDYPDRRMVYLTDMNDVHAKRTALEYVVQTLIKAIDNH